MRVCGISNNAQACRNDLPMPAGGQHFSQHLAVFELVLLQVERCQRGYVHYSRDAVDSFANVVPRRDDSG